MVAEHKGRLAAIISTILECFRAKKRRGGGRIIRQNPFERRPIKSQEIRSVAQLLCGAFVNSTDIA
jgi:hypothetical protein